MWFLLALHALGIVAAGLAGRASMRAALLTAGIAPAVTAAWAITELAGDGAPATARWTWVDALGLELSFLGDDLALMMTTLVSGIGALVFVYASGYFSPTAAGSVRFPTALLAFSTSMLGLVWADSIWTLFIFWELTSVTSFLLVGHKNTAPAVLDAARRALVITGGGGLVLLAGLMILGEQAGTTTLSELTPVSGTASSVAAVLVLVGAATKSAQFPFHVWLPGAMAAPTPVSAYLHSATMVKAGVLLVAALSPAFVEVDAWRSVGLAFGIVSMFWGAIGALRQRDAKLILAWGTVSQLGLLITVLALGSGKAIFAGISLLFAHALFKAALFLVVGEIDIRTGTRDIDELGSLYRSMPIATAVAVLAGASMAGVPPLLGFMAKEAAIEAALGMDGTTRVVALVAIVGGSVLTVAYTVRFLLATFGPGPTVTEVAPRRWAMTVPAVILGAAGVAGYVFAGTVTGIVGPAATESNAKSAVYELIRWPGLKTAFVISLGIVAAGVVLGLVITRRPTGAAPRPLGARTADASIDGVLAFAPRLTERVQHGSLPVYLATMGLAVWIASMPFLDELLLDHVVLWDRPVQGGLALITVAAAAAGASVRSRLGSTLALGAVGIGVSGLFVVHGAPDLALTQLVVETVIVVGFVLGLGVLGKNFPEAADAWQTIRVAIALAGGFGVTMALAMSARNPTGSAPVERITAEAVDEGGGKNLVNVILTDLRAIDTLGEVVVLATVAIGILALARARDADPDDDAVDPTTPAEVLT